MSFSKDFKWGVGTSAYQIEGAADIDGKGPSVWDMQCRRQGAVFGNHNGNIACDHYHRYKEDVKIMKEIGVGAYRMSISWPRILPDGTGKVNPQGIAFYDNLINELLDKGIEPFITLFHWDYPLRLYEKGGWLNPESSDWFAEYTKVVMEHFSDRVKNWITINEPQCFIGRGHCYGEDAPGIKLAFPEILSAGHNVLLSHGKSVQAIREHSKQPAVVGYAPVGSLCVPFDETNERDIKAAREATFGVKPLESFNSIFWMDSVLLGKYPEKCEEVYGDAMPTYTDTDMEVISEPIDYLGLNIYSGVQVAADKDGDAVVVPREPGHVYTQMGWEIEPKSLYWGPKFYYERYNKPLAITENGCANQDMVSADGKVHDPQRIEFLRRYMTRLREACDEGIDVKGYFLWSLLDNFEWSFGYAKRFGLVHVDLETQKRTIKDSGYWYKNVIETNGRTLAD
jgi:beta-glucosidase